MYKARIRHFYKLNRDKNLPGYLALAQARYEAKYGEGSTKWWYHGNEYSSQHHVDLPFGFALHYEIIPDIDHEPWSGCEEYVVRTDEGTTKTWPLNNHLHYDWGRALPIAIQQAWDAPPYQTGDKRQRALRALREEYRHWAAWLNDEWRYVGYQVTLYYNNEEINEESLWGIDSSDLTHLCSEMRDAAAFMLRKAHKKFFEERGDGWRQYELPLE